MKHKKKLLKVSIYVHWIQADLAEKLGSGEIDLSKHSLRDIGKILNPPEGLAAQKVKFHIEQLLKWGVINKVNGEYCYNRENRK